MATEIKDVVALVTGGASGLGKAIAEMIVTNGGTVVIVDVNEDGPSVAESLGERAFFIHADVCSEDAIKLALNLIKLKIGKLNVVVNSAGIFRAGEIYDSKNNQPHPLHSWIVVMNVNLYGTFNVMRLAIDLMKDNQPDDDNQRGVIINLSSVAGYSVPVEALAYGISKAGVAAMTEPVAKSVGHLGIRINAIAPGPIDTPMNSGGQAPQSNNFQRTAIESLQNLKRLGRTDEVSHLVKCIIENHFINAEVIRIDAGYRYCHKSHLNEEK